MLCAHVNHYIDVTKPIHPIAEELILRYTSINEKTKFLSASPQINEEGELLYNSAQWIIQLRDCILPRTIKTDNSSENTKQTDLITQWKRINKKDING